MKMAATVVGTATLAAGVSAAMLGSSLVCACEPAGYSAMSAFRTNPMEVDPEASRAAFLAKFPKGSPVSRVREAIGPKIYDDHCKESSDGTRATCTFDMAEGYFGQFRKGFEFSMGLDRAKSIEDVRFRAYKRST